MKSDQSYSVLLMLSYERSPINFVKVSSEIVTGAHRIAI